MSTEKFSYLDELKSSKDHFGHPKSVYNTLCRPCYKRLPRDLQNDLYLKMRLGYEEARNAAIAFLKESR